MYYGNVFVYVFLGDLVEVVGLFWGFVDQEYFVGVVVVVVFDDGDVDVEDVVFFQWFFVGDVMVDYMVD